MGDCHLDRRDRFGRRQPELFARCSTFASCVTLSKWQEMHALFGLTARFVPFLLHNDSRSLFNIVGDGEPPRFSLPMVRPDEPVGRGGRKVSQWLCGPSAEGRLAARNCSALASALIFFQMGCPESLAGMRPAELKNLATACAVFVHQCWAPL